MTFRTLFIGPFAAVSKPRVALPEEPTKPEEVDLALFCAVVNVLLKGIKADERIATLQVDIWEIRWVILRATDHVPTTMNEDFKVQLRL